MNYLRQILVDDINGKYSIKKHMAFVSFYTLMIICIVTSIKTTEHTEFIIINLGGLIVALLGLNTIDKMQIGKNQNRNET